MHQYCKSISTMNILLFLFTFLAISKVSSGKTWPFVKVYSWKQYIPDKGPFLHIPNVAPALAAHSDRLGKLILAIPRLYMVADHTLAEVADNVTDNSPKIEPFWGKRREYMVSATQIAIDECDRLWILETGIAANHVSRRFHRIHNCSIVVFNLKQPDYPEILRKVIPNVVSSYGFGQMAVDVISPSTCDDKSTYLYMPNSFENTTYVYDMKSDNFWKVKHINFRPEKSTVRFRKNLAGKNPLVYGSGIRAITLGDRDTKGNRLAYFLVEGSHKLWSVNTSYLKENKPDVWQDSSIVSSIGSRGQNSDATTLVYDPKTKVLFIAESKRMQIACWNTKKSFNDNSRDVIKYEKFFANHISIDKNGILWLMWFQQKSLVRSATLGTVTFNIDDLHYGAYKASVAEVIKGTKCA